MLFAVNANCSTFTRTLPSVVEQRDERIFVRLTSARSTRKSVVSTCMARVFCGYSASILNELTVGWGKRGKACPADSNCASLEGFAVRAKGDGRFRIQLNSHLARDCFPYNCSYQVTKIACSLDPICLQLDCMDRGGQALGAVRRRNQRGAHGTSRSQ